MQAIGNRLNVIESMKRMLTEFVTFIRQSVN